MSTVSSDQETTPSGKIGDSISKLQALPWRSCIMNHVSRIRNHISYIYIYIYIVSSPNNKTSHCTTKFQKVWLVKISFFELFGTDPPLHHLPRSVIFITTVSSPRFVTPGASSCWTDQGIWCNFLEEKEVKEKTGETHEIMKQYGKLRDRIDC